MKSRFPVLLLGFLLLACGAAPAGEAGGWRPLLTLRLGNIDAIDANDGYLAAFLVKIRNDGRFPPPVRTLVGPEISNPTLFGLAGEAWMECLVMAPAAYGPLASTWVFPVNNRDEYMLQLSRQGLSDYEGMDGVTVVRALDREGNPIERYLVWLPGNVAVFGADRDAVSAAKAFYAEAGASRGLLAGAGGGYVEADVTIRIEPSRWAAWQDREPGGYWWRERVRMLSADLAGYWRPGAARSRLMDALAEQVVAWPRRVEGARLGVWFERQGVEWRLEANGGFAPALPAAGLDIMRRLPERTVEAYAIPVTQDSFAAFCGFAGQLLLSAAGGAVTPEVREAASRINAALAGAGPRQFLSAWVAPPYNHPELGGTRLLLVELADSSRLPAIWSALRSAVSAGAATAQALSQMGWKVDTRPLDGDPMAVALEVSPPAPGAAPYVKSSFVARMDGNWLALAGGDDRREETHAAKLAYRAELAQAAATNMGAGIPEVREAFTRMGQGGAAFIGLLDPVGFMQLALVEVADWRLRPPDQPEPAETQAAREMLEYGSGGAWSVVGESSGTAWRFVGGMSWESLARLSAALGTTEAIGLDEMPQ